MIDGSFEQVEAELRRRYGAPTTDTDKMVGFTMKDERQLALQRDVKSTQIWLEDDESRGHLPADQTRRYSAAEPRHSNLPPRLRHLPPGSTSPRSVRMVTVSDSSALRAILDWYDGSKAETLDRTKLEQYRRLFLARYPDFVSFAQNEGGYFTDERAYKNKLIDCAAAAIVDLQDDLTLGARLLDLLTGRGGVSSNLLGWRTNGRVTSLRKAYPGVFEEASARLARAENVGAAVAAFIDETWPLMVSGQSSKPYTESRSLPTMLAAMVHPNGSYGINTDPVQRTAEALFGRKLFGWNALTAEEYAAVLNLAASIRGIMTDDWGWNPRDIWDVQGFIWVVNSDDQLLLSKNSIAPSATEEKPLATNLIFYGPPGTGKTYATAAEAVRLCGETVPDDRATLMKVYRRLSDAGRIEFVTFHQSTAYEEFVEGLRPVQNSDGGAAGFELHPTPGLFRRISRRAETSTGPGRTEFAIGDRKVFKMSIGEASNPEDAYLFEDAIIGGYTVLGYEDIDWSEKRFEDRDEIIKACLEVGQMAGDATPLSGKVQFPFIFRNWINHGDLIVVSKGNALFRAIGEVTGDYQFVPREGGDYAHRRSVRWLWIDRAGVLTSEIYARGFTQKCIYQLTPADLNLPTLERYIASQQEAGTGNPEPFVLIIDEINRANVSKVFGELITLLEPDKRLGQSNALTVRLPYSCEQFGVPGNLHVIGTMNTADRSIALLDTALRRRFTFRELMPIPSLLGMVDGINLATLLIKLNDAIEYLFDREHQVGHAYFIDCQSKADVDLVMRQKVIPLLAEYFHEDWNKVAAVLGDQEEEEGHSDGGFLNRRQLLPPSLFAGLGDTTPRYRWEICANFDYSKLQ